MSRQKNDKKLFTRRAFIFAGAKLALGTLIISRLAYLQIFKFSHYKLLSDKNRMVVKHILPPRGRILDMNNKILANNRASYSALLDIMDIPKECRNEVIDSVIKTSNLDDPTIEKLCKAKDKVSRSNRFVVLHEDLSWDDLAGYYIMSSKTPGIVIEKSQSRSYVHSEEFSHLIGYTGAPTRSEIENSEDTSLSVPMAKIGKTCIEKRYNEELFGKTGIVHEEVNSRRQFVRTIEKIESTAGEDIRLTINADLQLEVYEILSEHESSSCVVMDVNTGAILACVSYPGYDTNIFSKKIDRSVLRELYENPYKPMINKVISGLYSPGSTFKIITGLAGLNSGVITEHTRFDCSGVYELGNHKFHCWKWKYNGHGSVNLVEALAQSCDVYFYNLARLVGANKIAETARDFGLGSPTGIDLPNEKSGLIPDKKWKKQIKKHSWTTGDTLNMSIGQGFILATPLQLARMISIVVNGLTPIVPHMRQPCEKMPNNEKLNYQEKHIKIILDGLNNVVNSETGTARASATEDPNFMMGGKTGSTQVFRITEQQRRLGQTVSDDYWKKEHAIFVGYAPTENPKYAVSVLVEHGGGGSHTAAPIARDVLLATQELMES